MRTDPQMRIRLPNDCKSFVQTQAKVMASSQNAIVVRAIREMMDRQKAERPTAPTVDRSKATTETLAQEISK